MTASYERLFSPRSIAVVGASANPLAIGGQPIKYLCSKGFEGEIFPVNPRYDEIAGLRCYPNLAALPLITELVVLCVV